MLFGRALAPASAASGSPAFARRGRFFIQFVGKCERPFRQGRIDPGGRFSRVRGRRFRIGRIGTGGGLFRVRERHDRVGRGVAGSGRRGSPRRAATGLRPGRDAPRLRIGVSVFVIRRGRQRVFRRLPGGRRGGLLARAACGTPGSTGRFPRRGGSGSIRFRTLRGGIRRFGKNGGRKGFRGVPGRGKFDGA